MASPASPLSPRRSWMISAALCLSCLLAWHTACADEDDTADDLDERQAAVDALVAELSARSAPWTQVSVDDSHLDPHGTLVLGHETRRGHRATFARATGKDCVVAVDIAVDIAGQPFSTERIELDLRRVDLAALRTRATAPTHISFEDDQFGGGPGFAIDHEGVSHLIDVFAVGGQPYTAEVTVGGKTSPAVRADVTLGAATEADADALETAVRAAATACQAPATQP